MTNSFLKLFLFLVISFLHISCGSLIFHGSKEVVANPGQFNFQFDDLEIEVAKDSYLKGWLIKSQDPKRLLIQFHGNSENRSGHFLQFAWLTRYHTDVLIFDYRGFGDSSGLSGDREMKQDIKRILSFARTDLGQYQEVVLAGQSIGGHYLIEALKEERVSYDLVILDSTFLEYPSMLVKKIKSNSNLLETKTKITLPAKKILIIHGVKDPVIPVELSYQFERVLEGEKLTWYPQEGKHLDTFFAHDLRYRIELLKLLGEENWQLPIFTYSDEDKMLLMKKYCGNKDEFMKARTHTLSFFKTNPNLIKAPAECENLCLCHFYADLFKSLGSRRLSQSLYRQNSMTDESRELMCQRKVQEMCNTK
ncbi:MAG: alpha/beta hydrolase [Bacteriovoracaceae bacterium]